MNPDWIASAKTLASALPFLQRYSNAIVVIKLGGHAIGNQTALASFAKDIVLLRHVGVNPVILHGGGPMINSMLEQLNIRTGFVNGLRVTDADTIKIVEMVLSGTVNKSIVQAICQQGGKAIGLSGKDATLIKCTRADPDLGFVGYPESVDPTIVHNLFEKEVIPVIAPIGAGQQGETLNINGDIAAGAIAAALKADRLLLLTDVSGVRGENDNLQFELNVTQIEELISSGVISDGMIPKTTTALKALTGGVKAVAILDGRVPHAVLLELFTEHGAGTLIRPDKQEGT
ncbi:MAG: acetylglutamate kinase [Aestuariivita sp.]|nr:acetylglutamate kinase [Aestuariivita sp.]